MLTIKDLLTHCQLTHICGPENFEFKQVITDSRDGAKETVFVALKGERFDGHQFIETALKMGTEAIILEDTQYADKLSKSYPEAIFLQASDTLVAYGEIARLWRSRIKGKVILITGSVGKTTMKEMLKQILERHCFTIASIKNENNEIGVPKTILTAPIDTEFLILEAGMNHPGELQRIASYALPDFAFMMPICEAHIGLLGSMKEVVKAKAEILPYLKKDGVLISIDNQDHYDYFKSLYTGKIIEICSKNSHCNHNNRYQIIQTNYMYEQKQGFDFPQSLSIQARDFIHQKDIQLALQSPNLHDAVNGLAAYTLTEFISSCTSDWIQKGLEFFTNIDLRSKTRVLGQKLFWIDCYNANYTSMKASLQGFFSCRISGKKYLVLGEMLEMGKYTDHYHTLAGKFLEENKDQFDEVLLRGEAMKALSTQYSSSYQIHFFDENQSLIQYLQQVLHPEDGVFLKGSRKNKLEEIYFHYVQLAAQGEESS